MLPETPKTAFLLPLCSAQSLLETVEWTKAGCLGEFEGQCQHHCHITLDENQDQRCCHLPLFQRLRLSIESKPTCETETIEQQREKAKRITGLKKR